MTFWPIVLDGTSQHYYYLYLCEGTDGLFDFHFSIYGSASVILKERESDYLTLVLCASAQTYEAQDCVVPTIDLFTTYQHNVLTDTSSEFTE